MQMISLPSFRPNTTSVRAIYQIKLVLISRYSKRIDFKDEIRTSVCLQTHIFSTRRERNGKVLIVFLQVITFSYSRVFGICQQLVNGGKNGGKLTGSLFITLKYVYSM